MRLILDFKCEKGHVTERFIDSDTAVVSCETCGKEARKMLGMGTVMLDGTDPAFPSAYDHWANIRERRHRQQASKR